MCRAAIEPRRGRDLRLYRQRRRTHRTRGRGRGWRSRAGGHGLARRIERVGWRWARLDDDRTAHIRAHRGQRPAPGDWQADAEYEARPPRLGIHDVGGDERLSGRGTDDHRDRVDLRGVDAARWTAGFEHDLLHHPGLPRRRPIPPADAAGEDPGATPPARSVSGVTGQGSGHVGGWVRGTSVPDDVGRVGKTEAEPMVHVLRTGPARVRPARPRRRPRPPRTSARRPTDDWPRLAARDGPAAPGRPPPGRPVATRRRRGVRLAPTTSPGSRRRSGSSVARQRPRQGLPGREEPGLHRADRHPQPLGDCGER